MRFGAVQHSLGVDIAVEEAIKIVADNGGMVFSTKASEENKDKLKELAQKYQIELISGWIDNFIENGKKQPTKEFEKYCKNVCQPLDISVITTCSNPGLKSHRWLNNPDLEEQLERLAAAMEKLCKVAADYGVKWAIENHADYRADDLLQLLERVDSTQLLIQLDTGNPFSVAEEPVTCVDKLAPYAISTHIKDMTIQPMTDGEWCKVEGAVIGEGNVDFSKIVPILSEKAPDDLPFLLEVETSPDSNKKEDYRKSVDYVRENFSDFIDFA